MSEGQLIYTLDDEQYQIALNKAESLLNSAEVSLSIAGEDVRIAEESYSAALKDIEISKKSAYCGARRSETQADDAETLP